MTGSVNGDVVALAADSGAERWRAKLSSEILSTPLITSDMAIVRSGDGKVVALNLADGKRRWVFERPLPNLSLRGNPSPMLGANGLGPDGVFAASYKGKVAGFNPDNGSPLWSHSMVSYGGIARSGDTLYASDAVGTVWALDRGSGNALWKQDSLGYRWLSTPAVQNGYVVGGALEG